MKSKRKFFIKIMKIIIKDSMGQTVLSFDQKTCFDQKSELPPCFLTKILLKEKSAEPDPIKSALLLKKNDQNFIQRTLQVKPYCL